jgi:F-type H+-transporting ATPase subunit b
MAENTMTAITEPPSERGAGFPPFQKDTFALQLIWLTLIFVVLYLLMSRIALPRVGAILENRRQHVDADLTEADRLRNQSEEALGRYEKAIADARNRAQMLANEARQRQTSDAEASRKELDAKLNARIAEAEKDIQARQAAAMGNVHAIAADAAGAILEKLIGRTAERPEVDTAVADALKS